MSFLDTIEKNRQNFLNFNQKKFDRLQLLITNSNVKRVINAIPLLLCVNDKKIPGYIEGPVPLGIAHYEPDQETIKYIESRFHRTGLSIDTKYPLVQMLALMGSVGTIAYTKQSDFDYWVCIDSRGTPPEQVNNFQKKVEAIQKWAIDEIKIDVHLFINEIQKLKDNIYAEDETEAFGSTIGATLKDEFYRSSIIIAGKIPFWWVLPRIGDDEYQKLYNQLPEDIRDNHYIDLGNLYTISKEDFLGAALFQIIKALGNPFKSILKIGILEKYLFDTGSKLLISQKIKAAIHKGDIKGKILDSYVMMFEEVYGYYSSILEEKALLNILRQNLYLKINPQLSKYAAMKENKNLPYKVMVMFRYVINWHWNATTIKDHDNFDNWDYNKIMQFWNLVRKFMLLSYQKIALELPALNLAQRISESDFKLLSRKIKSYFSSNNEEIDNYITFKDTPHESILYIEPFTEDIDNPQWRLYKRNTSSEEKFVSTTLRSEHDLVRLLTWMALNQIFHPTFSRLQIQSGFSRINQNQILELLNRIHELFIEKRIYLKNDFFLHPSFNITNMVIINFNTENIDTIQSIYWLYNTSWGQSYIKKVGGSKDLIPILETILHDGINLPRQFDDYCAVVTPEPYKPVYKNLERLFRDSYNFILFEGERAPKRLITRLDDQYLIISRERGDVKVSIQPNLIKMLTNITLSPKRRIDLRFQGEDTRMKLYSKLIEQVQSNSITIFYEQNNGHTLLYVINEQGNLFTFIAPEKLREEFTIRLYEFCKNTIGILNSIEEIPQINPKISVQRITLSSRGDTTLDNMSVQVEEAHLMRFNRSTVLKAAIQASADSNHQYSISSVDRNSNTATLKELIIPIRQTFHGTHITPTLTGIEFSGDTNLIFQNGSNSFFLEKYRLEFILAQALKG